MSDELGTIGPCDFGGTLPGGFAAHTKLDHATGELHAIAYFWAWDHVQHVVVDAAGKVTRTTDIAVVDGPMMHDFALTGSYVVLLDLPVTFSLNAVAAGKRLPYVWNPAHQARVGLLPRDGSSACAGSRSSPAGSSTASTPTTTTAAGSWSTCARYNEPFDVSTLEAVHGPVTLDRWIIVDPASGKVTQQRLDDRGQEVPPGGVDRVISRPHRYGYSAIIGEDTRAITAAGDFADDAFTNALLRHDLARGTVEAHEFGRDATAGQGRVRSRHPPMPPRTTATSWHSCTTPTAAQPTWSSSLPRTSRPSRFARIHLPARIPLGFHGSWLADR